MDEMGGHHTKKGDVVRTLVFRKPQNEVLIKYSL